MGHALIDIDVMTSELPKFENWLKRRLDEEVGPPSANQKQSNELVAKAVTDYVQQNPGTDPAAVMNDPKKTAEIMKGATKQASKTGANANVADIANATASGDAKQMKKKMRKK